MVNSIAWSTTGTASSGGSLYANAGDVIKITYTFATDPGGFHNGDRVLLNNGQYAIWDGGARGTVYNFNYTVQAGSPNIASLALANNQIVPPAQTTGYPQSTYPTNNIATSSPGTTIVVDTQAPTAPSITDAEETGGAGDHTTNDPAPHISGTSDAFAAITVFRDATIVGTTTADSSGHWSVTATSDQTGTAPVNYTATAADEAGNASTASTPYAVTVDTATCFCAGTLLLTDRGEVPVERLAIGDRVVTLSGEVQPIRWIGRQTIDALVFDPLRAYPVRLAAGALGDGLPRRDLFLSPDHAVLVDGLLVHAGALVNGSSVTRITPAERVFTYYHVETAAHDVILAEGTPVETFVDNVTRRRFDNYAEFEALFGDEAAAGMVELDQPRAMSARQLPPAIRTRLAHRAALMMA